jgi:hypothetical protein
MGLPCRCGTGNAVHSFCGVLIVALLSERIEQSIGETVAHWYEVELNAAFAETSATIHMAANTGGGCSAIVVENIGGGGLDIVITQDSAAPHLASGDVLLVSLYPDFFNRCGNSAIEEMTVKAFEEHENAIQYARDLRDMALEIAALKGGA